MKDYLDKYDYKFIDRYMEKNNIPKGKGYYWELFLFLNNYKKNKCKRCIKCIHQTTI